MISQTELVREVLRSGREDGMHPEQVRFSAGQSRLLRESLQLLIAKGMYSVGDPKPLCVSCIGRDVCWNRVDKSRIPGDGEDWWHGVVSLPWVGRKYRPGGVLVLGINHYEASGLHQEIKLALSEVDAFRSGRKRMHTSATYRGSEFAYRTNLSATAVIDHLDGQEPTVAKDPTEIASSLDRIARLQTIKCAPYGDRSKPTSGMWRTCPPLLLRDQLEILRPSHIVAFGNEVFSAVSRLEGFATRRGVKHLRHGELNLAGSKTQLWGLYHPAAHGGLWHRSQEALVRRLKRAT